VRVPAVGWIALFVVACGSRSNVLAGSTNDGATMTTTATTGQSVAGSGGNPVRLENQFPCYPAGVELPNTGRMGEPITNPVASNHGYEVCVAAPSDSLIEHRVTVEQC